MAAPLPSPTGTEMSWDDYLRRGEDPRSEYIDGKLIVSPSPTRRHQTISTRLHRVLESALPTGFDVTLAWSWKPGRDEFIPDVMVHPTTDEQERFTGIPLLAVEVLSTNRSDDLVLKTSKYAAAGLPHYWVADPQEDALHAFDLVAGCYEQVLRADTGTVAPVAGELRPEIDIDALFAWY